jgi:hypothetical protein
MPTGYTSGLAKMGSENSLPVLTKIARFIGSEDHWTTFGIAVAFTAIVGLTTDLQW